MRKTRTLIALMALGMCGGFIGRSAQGSPAPSPAARSAELVSWELELDGGVHAKLTAHPGEIVRLTAQDGRELAFQPLISKEGESPVKIHVFRVIPSKSHGEEHFQSLETVELRSQSDWASSDRAALRMRIIPAVEPPAGDQLPRAAGMILSDALIAWELTFASGNQAKMVAHEGQLVRLRLADGGSFGFVPVIRDAESGEVSFRLFSLQRIKGVGEKIRYLESFDVPSGSEHFPESLSGSLIKVSGVRRATPGDLKAQVQIEPSDDVIDGCCVACGGARVCGCAVSMDCGDCCMGRCCGILEF